jgi:hypothetical protein
MKLDQAFAGMVAASTVPNPPQAFEERARANLGEFLDARAPQTDALDRRE